MSERKQLREVSLLTLNCAEAVESVNLYIDGELIGGCDITMEMHESGELEKVAKQALVNSED